MLNKVKHMTANLKNNNSPVTIVYPSANISAIFMTLKTADIPYES